MMTKRFGYKAGLPGCFQHYTIRLNQKRNGSKAPVWDTNFWRSTVLIQMDRCSFTLPGMGNRFESVVTFSQKHLPSLLLLPTPRHREMKKQQKRQGHYSDNVSRMQPARNNWHQNSPTPDRPKALVFP